jgi:hypothetical protein
MLQVSGDATGTLKGPDMTWKIAMIAAAISTLSASAAIAKSPDEATPAKPRGQCFWTSQVNNFASNDDKIVNLRVGVREVYQLEMFGRCNDIDWTQNIAVVSRGGSQICSGLDATIIAPSPIGPQRCPVKTVRKLTEAEIKALPKRSRP